MNTADVKLTGPNDNAGSRVDNFDTRIRGYAFYPLSLPPRLRPVEDNVHSLSEELQRRAESLFVDDPSKANLEAYIPTGIVLVA